MRVAPLVALALAAAAAPALAWGSKGHALGNRAAAEALPPDAPECLAKHVDALVYDSDEPDRWRDLDAAELDHAQSPEHYIDLEAWGDPATLPLDRWEFLKALEARPAKDRHEIAPDHVGLAVYRVLELEEALEGQLAASIRRTGPDREAAEELARTTAGVLGHYVLDLANPHHTTIHFNGWKGENPRGFTTDRGVHHLFESDFVDRAVTLAAVTSAVAAIPVRHVEDVRAFVIASLRTSHAEVETLYALEKDGAFARGNEATPAGERGRAFAVARIAAGAADLRDLWLAAWERAKVRAQKPRGERRGRDRDRLPPASSPGAAPAPATSPTPAPSPTPSPTPTREPD